MSKVYEAGVYETVLLINDKVVDLGHNCITHTTKYIRNNDLIDKAIVVVNGVKIKCIDIKKFNNFGIVNEYHRSR